MLPSCARAPVSPQRRPDACRELLATELVALVGESYSRAYADIVRAQQCAELSEVVQYLRLQKVAEGGRGDEGDADGMEPEEAARAEASAGAAERMRTIREVWHARLLGVERTVDVWTGLLAVRRLVLAPVDDVDVYLKYATMCRKEGKEQQGWRTLTKLLGFDPMLVPRGTPCAQPPNPQVRRPPPRTSLRKSRPDLLPLICALTDRRSRARR